MSKIFLRPKGLVFFILSAVVLSANLYGQTENLQNDLKKSFGKFDVVSFDTSAPQRENGANRSLSVRAAGKDFRLDLTARDLRAARYRAEDTTFAGVRELERAAITTFKGKVSGDENSTVRLTLDGEKTQGYFAAGGERYFIESARAYSKFAAPDEFVVYRAEDFLHEYEIVCNHGVAEKIEDGKKMVFENGVANISALKVIELATEADYDFVLSTGSAAAANEKILSILNMVEGVYENELGLTISVVFQHTYSAPDPFNGADSVTLLSSFQNYWNANYPTEQYPRDAAHLFTYKPNVRTQGYAYIAEMCKRITPTHPINNAYGLSGRIRMDWQWETANFLVTSHEIGHNLGAEDNNTSNCSTAVMVTMISGTTQLTFCADSRAEINNYVAVYGTCLSPRASSVKYDFEGDGKSDVALWRPSNGIWYVSQSSGGYNITGFGQNGDKPVAADYDGDGKTDFAIVRNGVWYRMRSSTNTFDSIGFGYTTDTPAPADFDGDGKTDLAVFRASSGAWFWLNSGNGNLGSVNFGASDDKPVPADYDGDGKADVNVFRSSNGTWYRLNSSTGAFVGVQFGANGDKPLIGDFDGDGKADVAVFRPADGGWYRLNSSTGAFTGQAFGLSTDIPAPADFDGDGKTDVSVFRPSNGTWYRLNSSNNSFAAVPFGVNSDIPAQSY